MNKIILSFLVIFLITTLIINKQIFNDFESLKKENQDQMELLNPNWKIANNSSNSVYTIECKKAKQLNSDSTFFLTSPLFRSFFKKEQKSLISSNEAILKISDRVLTMQKKVNIKLNSEEEIFNLITEVINLNLKRNTVSSIENVEMFSHFFSIKSKGFEIKEDSNGVLFMTFKKANLRQSKDQGDKNLGSADILEIMGRSDTLILRGSANITLNKIIMYADEIVYDFKAKSVISSVNPKIVSKA